MPSPALRMLRLAVPLWRVAELHRRLGGHEPGWVLHHAIGDACAASPPAPFCVAEQDQRHVTVLAYSRRGLREWRTAGALGCRRMGMPERHAGVTWERSDEAELPHLGVGGRFRFCARAAVIKRTRADGRPREVMVPQPLWQDWLAAQMRGAHVVGPLECQPELLQTTRRARWLDGGRSGPPTALRVPVLHLSGWLQVTDGVMFEGTLARGLGRHRSYGLGMIRLDAG